jgi:uncharacterized membrane protein
MLAVSSGIGTVFSLWLTYLEAFVIRAWCQWCVISALIVTIIFVASWLDLRELDREASSRRADEHLRATSSSSSPSS